MLPEYHVVSFIVTAAPMIFIVSVSAIKDAFEDYKRHRNDIRVNRKSCQVLSGHNLKNCNYPDILSLQNFTLRKIIPNCLLVSSNNAAKSTEFEQPNWKQSKWEDLRVGDIVRLEPNEMVPADMIIVSSSEPESSCFVETMNLDGETNLKLRQGPVETSNYCTPLDLGSLFKCTIESELPSPSLNRYQATMTVVQKKGEDVVEKKVSVDLNGILLRGTVVKNTRWVIGIVVATGEDTKLLMNSGKTPSKQSEMEKMVNFHIGLNLILMTFLCLSCAVGFAVWNQRYADILFMYGITPRSPFADGFINFWAGMILFQNIVPISLYISVEFAKTIQAYFIHEDIDMYYEENDTPCSPKSWNLGENLGQIEFIFTDKTGTLTRNIMEFKKCSIDGALYDGHGRQSLSASKSSLARSKISVIVQSNWVDKVKLNANSTTCDPADLDSDHRAWFDPDLDEEMDHPLYPNTEHGQQIHLFFTLLSVCHTVLIDTTMQKTQAVLLYKAQSPDEACLVSLAAENGYVFKSRTRVNGQNQITIGTQEKDVKFDLLTILEFDSERKRTSVIVRNELDEILLLCKGADSVIFERLSTTDNPQRVIDRTNYHLESFAEEGLRTLCLAHRKITKSEYEEWTTKYSQAITIVYPNPSDRQKALETLNNEMERSLILLGATAIEDKLQDGVPECIQTLMKANIKMWVLTGDKMETAINIGFLCGLLKNSSNDHHHFKGSSSSPNMILIQIKHVRSQEHLREQLWNAMARFWIDFQPSEGEEHALIIDGSSLRFALDDPGMTRLFLDIAFRCKTVICCRASPLQKARVVSVVKENVQAITLAIGDGANDVSMIQAAHVGIGISGEEGLQAAMSADYAIGQFRFLQKLLLVHGRWSYSRNALMILNFNLKSLVFSIVIFWFQFWCGFSANVIYDFSYMLFYNIFFTSLPIMAIAVFDRDLSPETCMKYPQLYNTDGIQRTLYTHTKYFAYALDAFWQSAVCYFVAFYSYSEYPSDQSGQPPSSVFIGTEMALSAILAVNLSAALDTYSWTWFHFLTYAAFVAVFPLYLMGNAIFPTSPIHILWSELFVQLSFWLCVVLSVLMSLGPRFIYYAISRQFFPSDGQIIHEVEKLNQSETREQKYADKDFEAASQSSEDHTEMTADEIEIHPHSITYNPDANSQRTPKGFSFAHTLGMAGIILKGPYTLLTTAISRLPLSRTNSRATTKRPDSRASSRISRITRYL